MHEGLLETSHASAWVTFYKGKPDDNKGDGDGVTELLHTRRQIHTHKHLPSLGTILDPKLTSPCAPLLPLNPLAK